MSQAQGPLVLYTNQSGIDSRTKYVRWHLSLALPCGNLKVSEPQGSKVDVRRECQATSLTCPVRAKRVRYFPLSLPGRGLCAIILAGIMYQAQEMRAGLD